MTSASQAYMLGGSELGDAEPCPGCQAALGGDLTQSIESWFNAHTEKVFER